MWQYYVLVFLSGAFTMTLELVAGRLVAPALGVSLYTWTSIIGVILAGMSAGSFLGGTLADRKDPRFLIGPALFISGLITLLILPGLPIMWLSIPFSKSPLVRVVCPTIVLFGIPALFIGLISPIVYRICLQDLKRTGTTVGRLSASGSLGSIVGTFATGFYLIPWFGTRAIVIGVASGLILLGLLFLPWKRRTAKTAAVMVALIAIGAGGGPLEQLYRGDYVAESAYYAIKISTTDDGEGGTIKKLVLDALIHSAANPLNPDYLWYEYERVSAWVIENWGPKNMHVLVLGGGGYTLPYWIERHYPEATVEVAEIDPEVTRIAFKEFIPDSKRIITYNEDARTAIRKLPAGRKYDLIFADAFNDLSVPYHLTTREFAQDVRKNLSDRGIYLANIVDTGDGPFLGSFARTMSKVFKYVLILPGGGVAASQGRCPHLVLASDFPVPVSSWKQPDNVYFSVQPSLPDEKFLVLTDDYAPVDNLLMFVFAEKLMK